MDFNYLIFYRRYAIMNLEISKVSDMGVLTMSRVPPGNGDWRNGNAPDFDSGIL